MAKFHPNPAIPLGVTSVSTMGYRMTDATIQTKAMMFPNWERSTRVYIRKEKLIDARSMPMVAIRILMNAVAGNKTKAPPMMMIREI